MTPTNIERYLRRVALVRRKWGLTHHTAVHVIELELAVPGLTITSGRRSWLRNRIVGGVKNSWHLKGRAVDVIGSAAALDAAEEAAWRIRVSEGCTGPEEVVRESDHLHIAW